MRRPSRTRFAARVREGREVLGVLLKTRWGWRKGGGLGGRGGILAWNVGIQVFFNGIDRRECMRNLRLPIGGLVVEERLLGDCSYIV